MVAWGIMFGVLKLKALVGRMVACLIYAKSFANLLSLALMTSGTLQPKVLAPTNARSTLWSSSLLMNEFRQSAGVLSCNSVSLRSLAARVLMSAADSEPIAILSAPFSSNLIAFLMRS